MILKDVEWLDRRTKTQKRKLSKAIKKIRKGTKIKEKDIALKGKDGVELVPLEIIKEFAKEDPEFAREYTEFMKYTQQLEKF